MHRHRPIHQRHTDIAASFLWAADQIAEEYAPDGTVSKRFFRQANGTIQELIEIIH